MTASSVRDLLSPVWRRLRCQSVLRGLIAGLLLGVLPAAALLLLDRPALALTLLGAATLAGLAVGWLRPLRWEEVAGLVDERSQLQDRAVAALEFEAHPTRSAWQQLQISDALARLAQIPP